MRESFIVRGERRGEGNVCHHFPMSTYESNRENASQTFFDTYHLILSGFNDCVTRNFLVQCAKIMEPLELVNTLLQGQHWV